MNRPKIITLCGSSRFPDAFALANMHLSMQGHIVISLGCFGHADVRVGARHLTSDGDETTPEKQHLDQLHFRKIDISDGIFVVNPGGYVGSSTKREIAHAMAQGKSVEWMFVPSLAGDVPGEAQTQDGGSIDTTPRNGTVVRVKNHAMDGFVEARFGKFKDPATGAVSEQWILVRDLSGSSLKMRPGTMLWPTEWAPIPEAQTQESVR